jgi:hypothetical protein
MRSYEKSNPEKPIAEPILPKNSKKFSEIPVKKDVHTNKNEFSKKSFTFTSFFYNEQTYYLIEYEH